MDTQNQPVSDELKQACEAVVAQIDAFLYSMNAVALPSGETVII